MDILRFFTKLVYYESMGNIDLTTRLFAKPSFIGGFSSVLDIGATLQVYNDSKTEIEADIKALATDWVVVGNDLKSSISNYEQRFTK